MHVFAVSVWLLYEARYVNFGLSFMLMFLEVLKRYRPVDKTPKST